jgi:diphthamide biosynthesis enzyme Dph1/Dph2-like protein
MKTIFIPVNSKLEINESKIMEISEKLPENIALVYSVQYKKQAENIKEIFSENHIITKFGQILGCSKPAIPKVTQAILLIGEGKFHALSLAYETKLPIYIYNTKLEKISAEELNKFEKSQKGSYINFLDSKKVGIMISTKPGQENMEKALALKKELKTKQNYLFIANNIDTSEFENFPEIQSWVNTACPRIDMNSGKIINLDKIK